MTVVKVLGYFSDAGERWWWLDLNQNINRRGKNWGKGVFILGGMDRIIVEWNLKNKRKWRVKDASKYGGSEYLS